MVGWRGMVGSVLLERMIAERDFEHLEAVFFSGSQVGQPGPQIHSERRPAPLLDAHCIADLAQMDIILSCQGSAYTRAVRPQLAAAGWDGYWIDAASELRMREDAAIALDPVNRALLERALESGVKNYIGGNCTVSLMLLGLGGLFCGGAVDWASAMTYQAASGAGAAAMREMLAQMGALHDAVAADLSNPAAAVLHIDRRLADCQRSADFPQSEFGAPLAGSLLPWIDGEMPGGQSREEWKAAAETNRILGLTGERRIAVDGLCVRVATMRCHAQALCIKLRRALPLEDIEAMLAAQNPWVEVVPNNRTASLAGLSPAAVSGGLRIAVGRLRKLQMGPEYLAAFTLGDQLLWGAAEPLRRLLGILMRR